MTENKDIKDKTPPKSKFWRYLLYIFLFFISLAVLLSLLLNYAPVQNYVAKKLTTYMSEKMDATVGLNKINIDFIYGVQLDGFYIVQGQDTVLNCKQLKFNLLQNLFSVVQNQLSLNTVKLESPEINLVIKQGETATNLEIMLSKLFAPDDGSNPAKDPIAIIIKKVDINALKFSLREENTGMYYAMNCEKLKINVENIDLKYKRFLFNSISLDSPEIEIEKFKRVAAQIKSQETASIDSSAAQLLFNIKDLNIVNGKFTNNDLTIVDKNDKKHFDAKHFIISDVNVDVDDLNFQQKDGLTAKINNLQFVDENGFDLSQFAAESLVLNDKTFSLEKFNLSTSKSSIGSEIKINYGSIAKVKEDLSNAVIEGTLTDTRIDLNDLFYFLPKLSESVFLAELSKNKIAINTQIRGNVSQLNLEKLSVNLGENLSLRGNMVLNKIMEKDQFNMVVGIDQLSTNMPELSRLLPKLGLPASFNNLGNLTYKGTFIGKTKDFGVNGILVSDIGNANLDLQLDLKNGSDKARYSGNLLLNKFDLGKITNNSELGIVDLDVNIKDGYSFQLNQARAKLKGKINEFNFKGYQYTNIDVDGETSQGKFDGIISSKDPNVDFDFNGNILYKDSLFFVEFDSDIRNIDLQKLNLNKSPLKVQGKLKINGSGQNVETFIGKLEGYNVLIAKADTVYKLEDIVVLANTKSSGNKEIIIRNKDLTLTIDGKVDLTKVVNDVKLLLRDNLPYYTKNWKMPLTEVSKKQDFRFDIDLKDLSPFADLLGIPQVALKDFKAKGYLNSTKNEIQLASTFPLLGVKNNIFYNASAYINMLNKTGYMSVHTDSSQISTTALGIIDISANVSGDTINWSLTSDYLIDSVERVAVRGILSPHDEGYQIRILSNDLKIYNKRWKLNPDNLFAFGKEYINIENFTLTDGSRIIELNDILHKGLLLNVNRFRFNAVNALFKDKKFAFDGEVISNVRINDIFQKSPDIYGTFLINDLSINGDSYGNLSLDISKPLDEPVEAILSIENGATKQAIKANGIYDPESKALLANVKGRKVPLKFLEYILAGGVKNVEGYADLDGTIEGTIDNIKINTDATLHDGKVKIVYLGETYQFNNQKMILTETKIDLTGGLLYDSEGNEGVITGGLYHTLFKNFSVNATIDGDNVIAINTTKAENPIYYGRGQGQVSVNITGPVNKVNMIINAVTRQGTTLNIPISESAVASNKNVITFIDKETFFSKDGSISKDSSVTISGMNIEMNLTMTPDAQVNMIFDESIGDVIKGRGNGNLRILSPRTEPLQIFGSYEIEQGEYLFTARKIIAKPFVVRQGGTLRWTGDPINAQMNIEADYLVRTSLQNFLQEFLYNTALQSAATQRTGVNVKLLLGNTLYNPTIQFDFEFPELSGELKNYAETKTRLLRNNISDFNGQVFSLIIWNSFLPSNTLSDVVSSSGIIQSAGINTLSEFLSSQVSLFVTSLINDALSENGLISGLDFNLSLRNNTSFNPIGGTSGQQTQSGILPSEIELRLNPKFRILDERLEFNVGGNYIRQNSIGQVNYVVPDFAIQYALTDDRKLNLKVYGRYDFDEIQINARRQKYGLGLRFRTEFGSMLETQADLSEFFKKSVAKVNEGK